MPQLPPDALKTQVDYEMGPFKEGLKKYEATMEARRKADPRGQDEEPSPGSLPWRVFCERHPDYDSDLWQECRALYAGGPELLRDAELMERLFPPHRNEDVEVYRERVARAHYFPYAGAIIDHLVAGLAADPVSIQPSDGDEDEKLPEWWQEFLEDCSPQGGLRQSMQQLLMDQVREALIVRTSWTLIDLPQTPEEYVQDAPDSLLAQERAGLLDPYAIAVEAEYVIDWQDDQNGELEWALLCDTELRRAGLSEGRENITKTFTYYDRAGWTRYQITYPQNDPPKPDTPVPFLDAGVHPFPKVPLVRTHLPKGLWAMGKLESLAREHLNKRNASSWAEYKALFSILYEFLAPEDGTSMVPVSEAQEDPARAISQVRGQGYSQVRGHQDDARFVGPDVAPFAEARQSCDQVMREMHRVMFSMALSVDTGSAAIRRSGESKAQDKAISQVVLRALGKYVRDHVRDIVAMVSAVKEDLDPRVAGAEKFDSVDVSTAVTEAVELLNGVPMKSPTFKKAYLLRTYKTVMGDELTEEELAEIREELDDAINAETEMLEDSIALMAQGQTESMGDDEDDDQDEEDRQAARAGGQPAPKANGGGGPRELFNTKR